MSAPAASGLCVLGIGNLLRADEGFGIRCLEALQARYRFGASVSLVDGGTQGLYLLPYVQQAGRLLILDAIDYGDAPGSLRVLRDDDVPRFLGAKKMSLHQTGFQEVLQLAQLLGHFPKEIVLIGCQPEELDDYGGSLRPAVRAAVEVAVGLAVDVLRGWGQEAFSLAPTESDGSRVAPGGPLARPGAAVPMSDDPPAGPDRHLASSLTDLARYEAQRPSAEAACRIGDERFLAGRPGPAMAG